MWLAIIHIVTEDWFELGNSGEPSHLTSIREVRRAVMVCARPFCCFAWRPFLQGCLHQWFAWGLVGRFSAFPPHVVHSLAMFSGQVAGSSHFYSTNLVIVHSWLENSSHFYSCPQPVRKLITSGSCEETLARANWWMLRYVAGDSKTMLGGNNLTSYRSGSSGSWWCHMVPDSQ